MNMMYDSDDDDDDDDDDEPPALVDFTPSTAPTLIDDDPPPPDADNNYNNNNNNPLPPEEETINPSLAEAEAAAIEESQAPPCPVTILSGFLGSGKTTLIQYILRDPNHKKKIAVIENEFGEGLDVESLIARDGSDSNNNSLQDLIELPNGCICCTVKDSLIVTLENLITKKSDLDYIIIESSGMANPGPIASVFWLDDALESRLKLDGIVTLVDAKNILYQLETTEEAAQQIAYADRILINKMDLVEEEEEENNINMNTSDDDTDIDIDTTKNSKHNIIETIKSTIRKLHPSAPYQCTKYSQVPDLDWILGANCFGGTNRIEELDMMWNQVQQQQQENHTHDHHNHGEGENCQYCQQQQSDIFIPKATITSSSSPSSPASTTGQQQQQQHSHQQHHSHTAAVVTVAYENKGSIDLSKLNKWLADILWPDQDETDKVLTAMLHDSQQQQQTASTTTTTATSSSSEQKQQQESPAKKKKSPSTQIFRIKGIVSVKFPTLEDAMMMMSGGSDAADDADIQEQQQQYQYYNPTTKLDQRRYIVQAVHDLWEVHPGSDNLLWNDDNNNEEERVCKIVIIGKGLNSDKLREGFLNCFV